MLWVLDPFPVLAWPSPTAGDPDVVGQAQVLGLTVPLQCSSPELLLLSPLTCVAPS